MNRLLAACAVPLLCAAPGLAQEDADRSVSLAEAFFLQRNGRTGGIELFGRSRYGSVYLQFVRCIFR